MDFSIWFLNQLPDFLMTPPISGFVGLGFLLVIVSIVRRIIHL